MRYEVQRFSTYHNHHDSGSVSHSYRVSEMSLSRAPRTALAGEKEKAREESTHFYWCLWHLLPGLIDSAQIAGCKPSG